MKPLLPACLGRLVTTDFDAFETLHFPFRAGGRQLRHMKYRHRLLASKAFAHPPDTDRSHDQSLRSDLDTQVVIEQPRCAVRCHRAMPSNSAFLDSAAAKGIVPFAVATATAGVQQGGPKGDLPTTTGHENTGVRDSR